MIRRILAAAFAVGLMSSAALAVDLSNLRVFPNPARVNRGDNQITFDNVGAGELKIFNAAGRLVFEKSLDASQTTFVWDLKNNDNTFVVSGIYVFFLQSGSDERRGKLGIIR